MISICTLYNEKPIGLVEKGGILHGFDPSSKLGGYRILVFFGPKEKAEISAKSPKNREISVKNR